MSQLGDGPPNDNNLGRSCVDGNRRTKDEWVFVPDGFFNANSVLCNPQITMGSCYYCFCQFGRPEINIQLKY